MKILVTKNQVKLLSEQLLDPIGKFLSSVKVLKSVFPYFFHQYIIHPQIAICTIIKIVKITFKYIVFLFNYIK